MAGTCITADSAGSGEFMLFGVRVVVDFMRKSVSMNNISQYEHLRDVSGNANLIEDAVAVGYASADEPVHHNSGRNRERKRGISWTEEEHKLFLLGLQKVGKGDWRGISRNFVKTRTPTQVASHAQKYFLRLSNQSRRRRRSSLFDITTYSVTAMRMDENQVQHLDTVCQTRHLQTINPGAINMGGFPLVPTPAVVTGNVPDPVENPMGNLSLSRENLSSNDSIKLVRAAVPVPQNATASMMLVAEGSLYMNSAFDSEPLSLKLSLTSEPRATPSRHFAFQAMPCFKNRDSIVSVA